MLLFCCEVFRTDSPESYIQSVGPVHSAITSGPICFFLLRSKTGQCRLAAASLPCAPPAAHLPALLSRGWLCCESRVCLFPACGWALGYVELFISIILFSRFLKLKKNMFVDWKTCNCCHPCVFAAVQPQAVCGTSGSRGEMEESVPAGRELQSAVAAGSLRRQDRVDKIFSAWMQHAWRGTYLPVAFWVILCDHGLA